MNRFLLPIVAFALLVAVFAIGLTRDPGEIPSPLIGVSAPQFSLPELSRDGETVSLETMLGRHTLLNVWASWCFACRQEHDFLLQLKETGTIEVFGLNWFDTRERALQWLADLGDPYVATAFDPGGKVGTDFGVYGAPETFLIGPDGTVLHKHVSPLTPAVWEREFVPRIAAGGAP